MPEDPTENGKMARINTKYREDAKKKIIAAAIGVAGSKGWDAVTLDAIAQNVGVTIPALYSYFENREALLNAVVLEVVRDTQAGIESVFTPEKDIHRIVEDFASLLFEPQNSCASIFFQLPVMVPENPDVGKELTEIVDAIWTIIYDGISKKKADHVLPQTIDPDEATRMIFAVTIGLHFSSLFVKTPDAGMARKIWITTVERSLLIRPD